jgi:hypothetical protein
VQAEWLTGRAPEHCVTDVAASTGTLCAAQQPHRGRNPRAQHRLAVVPHHRTLPHRQKPHPGSTPQRYLLRQVTMTTPDASPGNDALVVMAVFHRTGGQGLVQLGFGTICLLTDVYRSPSRFTWGALTNHLHHFKRRGPKVCKGLRPFRLMEVIG